MDRVLRSTRILLNRRQLYSRLALADFLRRCPVDEHEAFGAFLPSAASFETDEAERGLQTFYLKVGEWCLDASLFADLNQSWAKPRMTGVEATLNRVAREGGLQWASFHRILYSHAANREDELALKTLGGFFAYYKDAAGRVFE
jgi:hypothetical protein